jgi:hypothetical protein
LELSVNFKRCSLTATLTATLIAAATAAACGGGVRKFPPKEPVWQDDDRHPFTERPEGYYSPLGWDAADQTLFRPLTRVFAVDPRGEAANVNSMDEVPNSSWFTNRIGRYDMTVEEVEQGSCVTPPLDPNDNWTIVKAKPDGFNPGFIMKAGGHRYLLKFDGHIQGVRPTAADAIGSRIYHAAGYFTPCNRIVYFDPSIISIDPEATSEDSTGEEKPFSKDDLNKILEAAQRGPDGLYRANASLFIDGRPIGPWTYHGKRDDDPNDVVPHEERRDVRGMRLLAAWLNHFDSREQNTLGAFVKVDDDKGYVRHYMIDFGDSFGSVWEPPMLGRRLGHSYTLDFGDIGTDFVTLGAIRRPWDKARFGKSGAVFGYYDVENFDAAGWKAIYPNPAFEVMTERDGAWMARIISRFTDEQIDALIATGYLQNPMLIDELTTIMKGRRLKIIERYFESFSPLSDPTLSPDANSETETLCLEDLAVTSNVVPKAERSYSARAWSRADVDEPEPFTPLTIEVAPKATTICVVLPPSSRNEPEYVVVDVTAQRAGRDPNYPARVHLFREPGAASRIVGLERPEDDAPPE